MTPEWQDLALTVMEKLHSGVVVLHIWCAVLSLFVAYLLLRTKD